MTSALETALNSARPAVKFFAALDEADRRLDQRAVLAARRAERAGRRRKARAAIARRRAARAGAL